jgi:hypothetical protein
MLMEQSAMSADSMLAKLLTRPADSSSITTTAYSKFTINSTAGYIYILGFPRIKLDARHS